ncbi:MAG: crossover junction endodeoxyribonuclease RuvC [Candidatus Krumholzibacteria bacterium]|nr:crossover junction endodeoxyribonuclease RuvC [Candidatus Krumholzibacteria bacterium]MDH4335929.1 crossover junction endodeoxyribonuclease RuvC [Candidatus Krumholzibacteria bacterium]MDH5268495.1 crossover junction endodeoxyribonuclease RuvC [Candidatus Krumholzibacteria bacterium]MDH5628012.1 crossover junction endodeoxyribonuclease RuvC [Candidatus Krumholzibacteria bacterium]
MPGAGRIGEEGAEAARAARARSVVGWRILGVDPGSTCTGFGLVQGSGDDVTYLASGTILAPRGATRYQRLRGIYTGIERVIREHRPTHFAIEDVFYSKNPRSALVLGEARGAAILAASLAEIPIFEYSAREVKQSVTGNGAADKSQVSYMLGKILKLAQLPERADESDAIAIAMCHAFKRRDWSAK